MSTRRPGRRPRSATSVGLVLAALVSVLLMPSGAQATTGESWSPVNGAFDLVGRGYGHGRGMSQWGSYGAAQDGLSSPAILDFYYPGTSPAAYGDPVLRVRLTGDEGQDLAVEPNARTGSLGVIDWGAVRRDMPLPPSVDGAGVAFWRLRHDAGVVRLEGFWAGSWQAYPRAEPWVSTGPLEVVSSTGRLTLVYPSFQRRDYRDSLQAVRSGSGILTLNTVRMEQYLRAVVPAESPASWPAAALEAQSVAARTYTAHVRTPTAASDICDTEQCQVYPGIALYDSRGALVRTYEAATTDAAVRATAGTIRAYEGAPAFTQFSSSNGGWSVAGSQPYLVARPDPYDRPFAGSSHSWTASLRADAIAAAFGTGPVVSLTVNARDGSGEWGGRVVSVTVRGTNRTETVTGDRFRIALGLRSTWWTVQAPSVPPTDVHAVLTSGSGSGGVELHTLSRAADYMSFSRHAATALGAVEPSDWRFFVGPFVGPRSEDLIGVKLRGTGSGRVEVHVLSEASGYRSFATQVATAQPQVPTGLPMGVAVAPYAGDGRLNLHLVQHGASGSGRVEVHVLSAATGWSSYLTHAATALPLAAVDPGQWTFLVGDAAGSGDLVGVWHSGTTGSGRTEVHALSRVSGYAQFSRQVATPLELSEPGRFAFALGDDDQDRLPDLVALKKWGTGSGTTEVHVLSGRQAMTAWLHNSASALHETGAAWQLDVG